MIRMFVLAAIMTHSCSESSQKTPISKAKKKLKYIDENQKTISKDQIKAAFLVDSRHKKTFAVIIKYLYLQQELTKTKSFELTNPRRIIAAFGSSIPKTAEKKMSEAAKAAAERNVRDKQSIAAPAENFIFGEGFFSTFSTNVLNESRKHAKEVFPKGGIKTLGQASKFVGTFAQSASKAAAKKVGSGTARNTIADMSKQMMSDILSGVMPEFVAQGPAHAAKVRLGKSLDAAIKTLETAGKDLTRRQVAELVMASIKEDAGKGLGDLKKIEKDIYAGVARFLIYKQAIKAFKAAAEEADRSGKTREIMDFDPSAYDPKANPFLSPIVLVSELTKPLIYTMRSTIAAAFSETYSTSRQTQQTLQTKATEFTDSVMDRTDVLYENLRVMEMTKEQQEFTDFMRLYAVD